MEFKLIEIEYSPGIATIWLNKPQKRNAFNHKMITELSKAIKLVDEREENMVVLLKGKGQAFCAGADLNWMQHAAHLDKHDNYAETKQLSTFLYNLYTCSKVTIAVVHGAAFGGGIGLAAACDIVLCADETRFSLSELRVGLVASCISPYVVKKIGESRTRELVFTARHFDGKEAEKYGLAGKSVPMEKLDQLTREYVAMILKGAPKARELSKKLIYQVASGKITPLSIKQTAKILADVRVSKEATERIDDFLRHA